MHNSSLIIWFGTESEPIDPEVLCEDRLEVCYPKPEETFEFLEACEDWEDLRGLMP